VYADGFKEPVNGTGRDREKLLEGIVWERSEALGITGKPKR
jgi:hypothetical protein